jgi:hypothetical protein
MVLKYFHEAETFFLGGAEGTAKHSLVMAEKRTPNLQGLIKILDDTQQHLIQLTPAL